MGVLNWFGNVASGNVDAVPWLENPFNKDAEQQTTPQKQRAAQGSYWRGANGRLYWTDPENGYKVTDLGSYDAYPYKSMLGKEIADPNAPKQDGTQAPPSNNNDLGTGGAGFAAAPKVLDQAQLDSLDSFIQSLDTIRDTSKQKATLKRDTSKREKQEEKDREEGKYQGKKLGVLQDFAGAKTDTDLNTRNTLENLISSLSTMGLGGSRALTRQILDAANRSNRQANATQAQNTQGLDSAWNEFDAANANDLLKIEDQFGFDVGEAERKWGQDRQTALYKKADVFGAADRTAERQALMNEASGLNSFVAQAPFVNPSYTGEARAMATPELSDYTQDIARYDTTAIGSDPNSPLTPVGADGTTTPGNLAIRAVAVNDRDLGVKKKTEGDLQYGV